MYTNLVCSLLQVKEVGTDSFHKALSTLVEQTLERTRVDGRKPRFIRIMTNRELCRKVIVGSSSIMKYREVYVCCTKINKKFAFVFGGGASHHWYQIKLCTSATFSLPR